MVATVVKNDDMTMGIHFIPIVGKVVVVLVIAADDEPAIFYWQRRLLLLQLDAREGRCNAAAGPSLCA